MKLEQAQDVVKTMLADTILALCRNTLPYEGEFCVEGLLGITLDKKEIFLVNINQTIEKEDSVKMQTKRSLDKSVEVGSGQESDSDADSERRNKRKRKKRKSREKNDKDSDSDLEKQSRLDLDMDSTNAINDNIGSDLTNSEEDMTHSELTSEIKTESIKNDEMAEEDIVFVKEEPKDFSEESDASRLYEESMLRVPPGQSGYSAEGLGHLHELAMQLSGDMSSSNSHNMPSTSGMPPGVRTSHGLGTWNHSPGDSSWLINSDKSPWKIPQSSEKFSCTICGKQERCQEDLMKHMGTHTGEKPFTCIICGKGFTQIALLNSHMTVHRGEESNDYQCILCLKSHRSNSDLTKHMRIHTGEKPYKCLYCGKGFTQSTNLNTHMRVHTGQKPYKCAVCGKAFASSSNMKAHAIIHSQRNPKT